MIINNPFKKLAGYIVTYQANRLYKKAVKFAVKRNKEEKTRIYVIEDPIHPRRLITLNRTQFRKIKRNLRIYKGLPVSNIKDGAFYYTPDAQGKDAMSQGEISLRRLGFTRMLLQRAKLL